MKIAIIYATVGGTTRECAELLARELEHHEVTLMEMGGDGIEYSEYDALVIGFPIRMGKAMRVARKYMKQNAEKLVDQKVAYFMTCGFIDCFDEYAQKVIPESLRASAIDVACLGGSLEVSRFKGFDKLVVRSVRDEILGGGENGEERDDMTLPTILEENIAQLADKLRKI